MGSIWQDCNGPAHIGWLDDTAIRVVESQEQIATLALVDTPEEQVLLESLLEESKPPLPPVHRDFHYLIITPFRYPPLPYGSRFGSRLHLGLFYGSQKYRSALAECAYYRLLFWTGMSEPPQQQRLVTEHTTFEARVKTDRSVALHSPPFACHHDMICHPNDYSASQALGEAMRDAGVEAFTYPSARDAEGSTNIGIFTPRAIRSRKLLRERCWLCVTTANKVSFMRSHAAAEHYQFPLEQFLFEGTLPVPAC